MVNPVPGYSVTTGYKKQGSHWTTCGWHTGQDYAAPAGTPIVAARGGLVAYVDYGSSFGSHQWVVRPGDGTEDFYAHAKFRPVSGIHVAAGSVLGQVGSEGNATGPHLHFERHSSYGWGCSLMQDPMLSHNAGGGSTAPAPEPAPPNTLEDEDMFIVESPGRGAGLLGPGYYKSLTLEERDVLTDLGVRRESHNDRGYDVAVAACMQGDALD